MEIEKTELEGVVIIKPTVFKDDRGYFYESWNNHNYNKVLDKLYDNFVQDNESCSQKNTFRGMHWQLPPFAQSKLVRCVKGSLVDIVCDIRKNSETFGKFITVNLNEINKYQLFIPRGFAHGFLAKEDNTIINYKTDNYYNKTSERSFNAGYLINIDNLILSEKDRIAPSFYELKLEDLF